MSVTHPQNQNEQQSASLIHHSRFYPHLSSKHTVTKNRYITSSDTRGYIPVYEYPLNGHWLMIDSDNSYILWTSIWKALGNSKADIVKIVEAQPEIASQLRRVRGGYLKIQGTWMPYEIALVLARRVAWPIKEDLIPLFGPTFPSTCLTPDQPGFGQLLNTNNPSARRRTRRTTTLGGSTNPLPVGQVLIPYERGDNSEQSDNCLEYMASTSDGGGLKDKMNLSAEHLNYSPTVDAHPLSTFTAPRITGYSTSMPPGIRPQALPSIARYSPYPAGERSSTSGFQPITGTNVDIGHVGTVNNMRLPPPGSILLPPIPVLVYHRSNSLDQQRQDYSSLNSGDGWTRNNSGSSSSGSIGNLSNRLPITAVSATSPPYSLPPISALDAPGAGAEGVFDVLRRLRMDDDELEHDYYCDSGRSGDDRGQWENSDNDAGRYEGSFQSSIIPNFQQPCDPARARSTSLTCIDGARNCHVSQQRRWDL